MAWGFPSSPTVRDHSADRRALETRAAELNAQVLAPGSPLACLDGSAGESVETACEKALFATPATVASATSYVAARFALLSDMVTYTNHGGANIDNVLLPLRHALETDRFGFVAHELVVRDGCSSQKCKALALLHDPSRVRTNLSAQPLDRYIDHYLTVWAQPSDGSVADAAQAKPVAAGEPGQPGASGPRKVLVDVDFPSAASIPAVSIMNPEPKGPVVPGAAAAAAANPNPPSVASPAPPPSSRKSRKQAANPPPPAPAPSRPADPPAAVDPVWMPAPTAGAAAAPAAGAPVQLTPPASPPEASATMRTQ
jgi:hypothetical protein